MLELDVSQLELAQTLKEVVDITRVDLGSDASGRTMVGVVSVVEMIILPATTVPGRELSGLEEVRATGQTLVKGYYDGMLLTPNDDIQVGDLINRVSGKDPQVMYVLNVNRIANVQWLRLSTTRH